MTLPKETIMSWGDDLDKFQTKLRNRATHLRTVPGNNKLRCDLEAAANALNAPIRTLMAMSMTNSDEKEGT